MQIVVIQHNGATFVNSEAARLLATGARHHIVLIL